MAAQTAWAQSSLSLRIVSAASDAPVSEAVVRSWRLQRTQPADRTGTVRFGFLPRPDTLLVAALGFRPETLAVRDESLLTVGLMPHPVTLADLTVAAGAPQSLSPAGSGGWTIPAAAIRALPAAIEPDPIRALAAIPSVTFSSPLSARPLLRGYGAGETVTRLNGFELINPYHLGGTFSSFPADATEDMTVAMATTSDPLQPGLGGTVDIRGRATRGPDAPAVALAMSVASASASLALRTPAPAFAAYRTAYLGAVTGLLAERIPYTLQDAYSRLRLGLGASRTWDLTLYGSRDLLGDRTNGQGTETWNLLTGNRWRLAEGPSGSLDLFASGNRAATFATDVRARNSSIDLTQRFDRVSAGATATLTGQPLGISLGASVDWRHVSGLITPRSGEDYAADTTDSRLLEGHAFLAGRLDLHGARLEGALGASVSREAARIQPSARASVDLSSTAVVSLAAMRACRLYQFIYDEQPEPAYINPTFWLDADGRLVPVPCVNHLAGDVDYVRAEWSVHASGYGSRGQGLAELTPISDQRTGVPPFRYGSSRTVGLELRAAVKPAWAAGASTALTYVWARSDRRWDGGGWVPWMLDRRHTLRLQVDAPVGNWRLSAVGEYQSGQPLTSVAEVVWTDPAAPRGIAPPSRIPIAYRYGAEGGARGAGTLRCDVAARVAFRGPGASRIELGFSVLNAGFGPVAPDVPVSPSDLLGAPGAFSSSGVRYVRRFGLPAIPSVTARVEF